MYPGISQVGYLFHLTKNAFRHVQDIGLQQKYLMYPLFRDSIRMILALSFVPVQDIILAFDEPCNHCGIDEQPVLGSVETNTLESCEGVDFCCRYSLTSCGMCIIRS